MKIDEDNPKCDKCDKEAVFFDGHTDSSYCREHAEKAGMFDFERNYKPINMCK